MLAYVIVSMINEAVLEFIVDDTSTSALEIVSHLLEQDMVSVLLSIPTDDGTSRLTFEVARNSGEHLSGRCSHVKCSSLS